MPPNLERGNDQDLAVLRRAEAGEIAINEWAISYYWCTPDGSDARRMRCREQDHVAILETAKLLTPGDRRVLRDGSGERTTGFALILTEKGADLLRGKDTGSQSVREELT